MQDKFDHGYDLQQIATDDLYLVLRWVNVESPEFTLDQEFVVECLAIISKFWNDFRACKSLLAWYEKIYC
ncbi:MAG TPA: hypothetical protein DCL21_01200 [Alphaproteobacteria bacterium]|mgnify:CR=1 FL=1|nr:hypothetical protein [Alphaproteobacteria bacterium]